ncbi:unnamed protein product, partial [Phaeothamnion confervicola]
RKNPRAFSSDTEQQPQAPTEISSELLLSVDLKCCSNGFKWKIKRRGRHHPEPFEGEATRVESDNHQFFEPPRSCWCQFARQQKKQGRVREMHLPANQLAARWRCSVKADRCESRGWPTTAITRKRERCEGVEPLLP